MSKCGSCRYFIGGGDWNLCCSKDYYLHYEDSPACDKYDPLEIRTCYCPICDNHFEIRSNDSQGNCPACGHHVVLHGLEVDDD